MIANWPGVVPAGVVRQDLIDFTDFFPTFAELVGAALPQDRTMDGRSFLSQIKGQVGKPREWVYVELSGQRYVRNERWKLTGTGEMFDLKDAPFAEIPMPADTANPAAIAARKRLHEVLLGLVGAQVLAAPPGPRAAARKQQRARNQNNPAATQPTQD
jgi:arylsulfatase A